MRALFFCFVATIAIGCNQISSPKRVVNITVGNDSAVQVWAEVQWSGPDASPGVLSPGIEKTAVSVEWPNLPSAMIEVIDQKTQKRYTNEVSFAKINPVIQSGNCHDVRIGIVSFEKTEVRCK